MGRGRLHRHLPALPAARGHVHFLQRQRHEARRHVLARGDHGVVFAGVEKRRGFLDPADKLVGLAGHGRDDDDHVIAIGDLEPHALGGAPDAVQRGDGCAAEFHDEDGHRRGPPYLPCGVRSYGSGGGRARGGWSRRKPLGALPPGLRPPPGVFWKDEGDGAQKGCGRPSHVRKAPVVSSERSSKRAISPDDAFVEGDIGRRAAHVRAHPAGVIDADRDAARREVGGEVAAEIGRRRLGRPVDVAAAAARGRWSPSGWR
jgi:hypothetical protein